MSDVQTRIGIAPVVVGGGGARSELRALWEEFKSGKLSVEEFNQEMRNTSGAIYAQRRVIMLMRTEYRNTRAALYEAMRGFRAVARIGRTITSVFTTYTLMQIRVADKTRDIRDAQEDLAKIQERRIRVVKDLGSDNAIALRLMNEEDRLTTRLTDDRRDLKRAQDQNIIGYVGIGLQTLQVIPTMVALNRHIDLTKLYMGESWSYTGLAGIVTSAANAEVAILGVKTTYGTLASLLAIPIIVAVWWNVATDLAEKMNEQYEAAGLPVTTKKPGDPGMKPLWPGVYVDEELLEQWPSEPTAATAAAGLKPRYGILEWLQDISTTVEGEGIDVQVDVTVTQTGEGDEGEGKHK